MAVWLACVGDGDHPNAPGGKTQSDRPGRRSRILGWMLLWIHPLACVPPEPEGPPPEVPEVPEVVDTGEPPGVDSDGDGLDDAHEAEAGTDPLVGDSDGDGFLDGHEVATGSDPLHVFVWPPGEWADFTPDTPLVEGDWTVGQVAPDIQLQDQHGAAASLHQFYGMSVYLQLSAEWNSKCSGLCTTMDGVFEIERRRGLMVMELLVEDRHQAPPDLPAVEAWSINWGLGYLVGRDVEEVVWSDLEGAGLTDDDIPVVILLTPELIVHSVLLTPDGDEATAAVQALLGD